MASFGRCATFLLCVGLLLSTAGCVGTRVTYSPRDPFSVDRDIQELSAGFKMSTSIEGYYSGGETREKRNKFLAGRIALYDLEYLRFTSQFRISRAEEATIFDGLLIGLTFATTVLAGEHTKEILGAGATAMAGWRASYERNYYEDKTSVALLASMNAERRDALIPLMEGSRQSLADYPFEQAVADLNQYRAAGSMDAALMAVLRVAAAKEASANAEIQRLRKITYAPDASSFRIARWLLPSATFNSKGTPIDAQGAPLSSDALPALVNLNRRDQLIAEVGRIAPGVPWFTLMSDSSSATLREKIIQQLSIP